ncbi:hypothetical protein FB45DRAFT_926408 [Roridomyces roridus]|nr:hypothetical protein FB45DRAFT_926408 [Roridomyces roridus]
MSVDVLDRQLPSELQRLDALKATTQSKYRFTVHRRTMLMQALHSFSGYNDSDPALVGKLTSQLSQTTAECDQLLQDLLQISDQAAQIQRLQDIHFSSALSIALRKLNSSYGRRTTDLLSARDKIASLEAEINDAWQQADKLAREMDEADAASDVEEEDTAVIEIAEVVSLNHRKSPSASSVLSVRPFQDTLSLDAVSRMHSEQSQVTPEPTQIKLPSPTPSEAQMLATLASDVASVHSNHSVKSSRTQRSQRNMDRVSVVSAARRRSLRTSMGSLRMPSIKINGKGSPHPPVPALPTLSARASPVSPSRQPPTVESFLDFGGRDTDESSGAENDVEDVDPVPRRTSIEEIEVVAPRAQAPIVTRDDIHVMPSRSATETELVAPRRSQFSLDHQHPFANEEPVNTSIPSIWLLQDTPKTPAERVESLMQDRGPGHTKLNSFQRLKSLTKRYSLPFPTTVPRSRPGRNATAGS